MCKKYKDLSAEWSEKFESGLWVYISLTCVHMLGNGSHMHSIPLYGEETLQKRLQSIKLCGSNNQVCGKPSQ